VTLPLRTRFSIDAMRYAPCWCAVPASTRPAVMKASRSLAVMRTWLPSLV
jgi:hypothetical protein